LIEPENTITRIDSMWQTLALHSGVCFGSVLEFVLETMNRMMRL